MKTKDEYIEITKRWIEVEREDLIKDECRPKMTFLTDEDTPRVLFFPKLDGDVEARDLTLWATTILGTSIDNLWGIAYAFDSIHTLSKTKTDGTAWGYGEMQDALRNNTVDAHLVEESFCYQVHEKDGGAALVSVPYDRPTPDSIEFRWDDAHVLIEGEGDGQLAGTFAEAFSRALHGPKLITAMKSELGIDFNDLGLDLEAARMHTLSVAVKMVLRQTAIKGRSMQCLVPCHSQDEADLLKTSMTEGPFSEGIMAFSEQEVEEIVMLDEAFDAPAYGEEQEQS